MPPARARDPRHPQDEEPWAIDPPDALDEPDEPVSGQPRLAAAEPSVVSPDADRRSPLEGLSIAGITRRRAAFVLLALVTVWVLSVFARQVGDASAAADRADAIRSQNEQLTGTVASLGAELRLVQTQPYIEQQARAYGLGSPQERAFTLAPGASALPSNAPGSAAVRLGATTQTRSPLETWLTLLFGPSPTD